MDRKLSGERLEAFLKAVRQGSAEEELAESLADVAANPGNALAHFLLGAAYRDLGRFEEAEKAFRESYRLDPEYYEIEGMLGATLVDLHRPDEAEPFLKKALEKHPNNHEAASAFVRAMAMMDKPHEALEVIRSLVQDENASRALIVSGYITAGKFKEAMPFVEDWKRAVPDSKEAVRYLGECHFCLGNYGQSVNALRDAVAISPENNRARYMLGSGLRYLGLEAIKARLSGEAKSLYHEAIPHLRQAYEADPEEYYYAALDLAYAYGGAGNIELGKFYAELAMNDERGHDNPGLAQEAQMILQRLSAFNPDGLHKA